MLEDTWNFVFHISTVLDLSWNSRDDLMFAEYSEKHRDGVPYHEIKIQAITTLSKDSSPKQLMFLTMGFTLRVLMNHFASNVLYLHYNNDHT